MSGQISVNLSEKLKYKSLGVTLRAGLYAISSKWPKSKILTCAASCCNPERLRSVITSLRIVVTSSLPFHYLQLSSSKGRFCRVDVLLLASFYGLASCLTVSHHNLLYKGIWTLTRPCKEERWGEAGQLSGSIKVILKQKEHPMTRQKPTLTLSKLNSATNVSTLELESSPKNDISLVLRSEHDYECTGLMEQDTLLRDNQC